MPKKKLDKLDDDDRPWDEARWRAFLRESELRSARYAELFETLIDDPDRDKKVAREMGWADRSVTNERGPGYGDDDSEEDGFSDFGDDEIDPNDPELLAELAADERALHRIPAYRISRQLASITLKAMKPLGESNDERVPEAIQHALIPGAKIAGGHGIGYDDDAICGNIVCNTIALDSARKAIGSFTELVAEGVVPQESGAKVLAKLHELVVALDGRIAELRARVTW